MAKHSNTSCPFSSNNKPSLKKHTKQCEAHTHTTQDTNNLSKATIAPYDTGTDTGRQSLRALYLLQYL